VRILLDTARNLLRFRLREGAPAGPPRPARGTVDMGEGGRLLGLELSADAALAAGIAPDGGPCAPQFDPALGTLYLPVTAPVGGQARAAEVEVLLRTAADGALLAVDLPRRGHGYEIAYPSGNR